MVCECALGGAVISHQDVGIPMMDGNGNYMPPPPMDAGSPPPPM